MRYLIPILVLALGVVFWATTSDTYPTTGNPGGGGNTFMIDGHALQLPGTNFAGWARTGAFDAYDAGDFCLNQGAYNAVPADCGGLDITNKTKPFAGAGAFVDRCVVMIANFAGWDAAGGDDTLFFQLVVIEENGAAVTDLGDPFNIINATTGCAAAPNCAEAIGSYEWQVDGTVSGSTLDVAGALTAGGVGIEIDAASNDVDGDADLYITVHCTMYPIL